MNFDIFGLVFKVYILTEGTKKYGYGHLTRCLSLYQAFQEKGIRPHFIVNGDDGASDILKNVNVIFFDWCAELNRLLAIINNADVLIIDSYVADIESYKIFSKAVHLPVYLDDTNRLDYPRGIVINGGIYAEMIKYPKTEGKSYLLGLNYQPLRKAFWNVPEKSIYSEQKQIFISLGGSDTRNLTPEILELVVKNFPALQKIVVIGNGFSNIKSIEKQCDKTTRLCYNLDDYQIKELMLQSNVAISAAGQTLYELGVCKVTTIAVKVAENQNYNIKGFAKLGNFFYAGKWSDKNLLPNILKYIQQFLNSEIICNSKRTINPKGSKNIINGILERYLNISLLVRNANASDIKNVFQLSNEKEVRSNSLNKEQILWEKHLLWYKKKIIDKNCDFYVIYHKNHKFVGQVRYDILPEFVIVNISINSEFRGFGIATYLLKHTAKLFFEKNINPFKIVAKIKFQNKASLIAFEKAGYLNCGEEFHNGEIYLIYCLYK